MTVYYVMLYHIISYYMIYDFYNDILCYPDAPPEGRETKG